MTLATVSSDYKVHLLNITVILRLYYGDFSILALNSSGKRKLCSKCKPLCLQLDQSVSKLGLSTGTLGLTRNL